MIRYAYAALAALLAFAALGSLTRPAIGQGCTSIEQVASQIRHEVPGAEIRTVVGAQASRLGLEISALIGQSVPEGGSYLIARAPDALTSYIVRFADGCATHHGRFPDRLVRRWLDGSPA
jgi:hypothetical protein